VTIQGAMELRRNVSWLSFQDIATLALCIQETVEVRTIRNRDDVQKDDGPNGGGSERAGRRKVLENRVVGG
jgi:hypothetical protein